MNEYLRDDWLEPQETAATRDGFGVGLLAAAEKDERIVMLCADLAESTRVLDFKEKFPARFIEMGVAEQNMASVAAGLAQYGKHPFMSSYAAFSPGRNYEQIRTTIAINHVPVVVAGMHAGVSVGPDGATHQMLEDIGMMRMLPGFTVIVPADSEEARKATIASAALNTPVYLRFGREKSPVFTATTAPFEVGKANVLREDADPHVALIACGVLVHNALLASAVLEKQGVGSIVINNHTIKPLDTKTLLEAARKTGAIVTIEEHQVAGGMGSAIAELLSRELPTPQEFIGVHDQFGQSGKPAELIEHYGMGVTHIVEAAKRAMSLREF